ncbi:hypothetical protein VTO42DRAFT_8122 [Malbranchea cinnamomea]
MRRVKRMASLRLAEEKLFLQLDSSPMFDSFLADELGAITAVNIIISQPAVAYSANNAFIGDRRTHYQGCRTRTIIYTGWN